MTGSPGDSAPGGDALSGGGLTGGSADSIPTSPLDEWTARRLGVQRLTREAIERWQVERLREVVAWAKERSPLYREAYAGVSEDALTRVADIASLPLLERDVLRERGPELVCVSLNDIARVVTVPTTGSTGSVKRLSFTEDDMELTADHFRNGMRALVDPGDRVLVLMPGKAPGSVGALLQEGLGRDGIEVHSYGFIDDPADVTACLRGFAADCLVGVPGQLVRLARSVAGRRIGRDRIKSVLFSGDHVTPAMRAAVQDAWGCLVFEHYGSTESGLGGAVQCRAFAGLHIREADLLFEVIDPETGRPLPDGAEGELVMTTLTRRGMPLIRFRTGDLVRMATVPCVCGSALRCVERVIGRAEGRVGLGPGLTLTVADLDEAVYAVDDVLGFNSVLDGEAAGDRLSVHVEADAAGQPPDLARVAERVRALPAIRAAGLDVVVDLADRSSAQPLTAKQRIVDARAAGRADGAG